MGSRLPAALAVCTLLLASEAVAQGGDQLSFASVTARPGEERVLSLNGSFETGVSGLVVTVLFDPTVIQILGVELAPLTANFTLRSTVAGGRLTIAMAAASPVAPFIPEPIVRLTVRVIGAPGAVTGLDIASAVVNEGDVSVVRTNGSVRVVREARVLGWTLYYADLRPVPDVVLTATGAATVRDTTGGDGRYELGPMVVGDYTVTLQRGAGGLGEIDALDAADILRHLIGAIALSGDQSFVADVSGNGVIGTTDAALILRYLVGLETGFPAGAFWQFRPRQLLLRPLIQDEFRNFTAYLLGDVDGSALGAGSGKRLAGAGPRLRLASAPVRRPAAGRVIIRGEALQEVRAGALRLRYDPTAIRAREVRRQGMGEDYLVATNAEEAGVVRIAFAGAEGLTGDVDLVRVDFDEVGAPGTQTQVQLEAARLNRGDLPPAALDVQPYLLAKKASDMNSDGRVDLNDFFVLIDHMGSTDPRYDLDGSGRVDMGDIFVVFDDFSPTARAKALQVAAAAGWPAGPELAPNAPNPFNSSTAIAFRTAVPGPVALAIYDLAGQRVRLLVDGVVPGGAHTARWDGRDDAGRPVASGLYLCQLSAQDRVLQGKLLLLR